MTSRIIGNETKPIIVKFGLSIFVKEALEILEDINRMGAQGGLMQPRPRFTERIQAK